MLKVRRDGKTGSEKRKNKRQNRPKLIPAG